MHPGSTTVACHICIWHEAVTYDHPPRDSWRTWVCSVRLRGSLQNT